MKKARRRQSKQHRFLGFRFDFKRSRDGLGDLDLLSYNVLNRSVQSGTSMMDALMEALSLADRPIPVKFISEKLREPILLRGRVFFGDAWKEIDDVVQNYQRMRWWITVQGLVIDEIPPELDSLSEFERIVGPLVSGHFTISVEMLRAIADKLDSAGFKLKDHLQPVERKAIAAEHQKHHSTTIHNFASAVSNPRFVRMVRRAIYRAREKYEKALAASSEADWTPFIR